MELAQLLQASSSVASTPPWAVGGSPAPERKRTETTLDALLNADETASNPAQVDRDDPAFLSAPSQLGKRPRDGDSLLSNSHLESVGSTSLAPGILQNTTTGIYAPYPAFPTTNGLFGQTGQHPPPKLAFGAAASPTAPPRMFGLTVAPSAISMQFAQFPQTHFEYNPVQDPSQPRQATQHDAGVASGSERTLELALAELLSEDRRMLALEAEKQAKSKQRKPTSDDDEPPYEELPDEDDGQDYSYGSQKKGARKGSAQSQRRGGNRWSKPQAGATTGRSRKPPVPIATITTPREIAPRPPAAERKPALATLDRKTTLQRSTPSVASSSAGTPVHLSSHTASPAPVHQRPIFSAPASARGSARAASPFDSYTPNAHSSEEDDEEFDSSALRRKGKGRAMRDTTERARVTIPEDERDDRLYCVCARLYDPDRMMLACDKCEDWYHPECVQIPEAHVELVDQFVCPNCAKTDESRTTWKQRCARPTCLRPVVPLSKYCSDYCGIEVAATRLELSGMEPERFWHAVVGARRREGAVVVRQEGVVAEVVPKVDVENDMDVDGPLQDAKATPEAALEQAETDARSLALLQEKSLDLFPRRQFLESKLSLITARLRYLAVAIRRWEAICQATAQVLAAEGLGGNSSKPTTAKRTAAKKSKGGRANAKPAATNMADAQCGFDVRLVYGDEEWEIWVASAEGVAILGVGGVGGTGGDSSVEGTAATEGAPGMDIIEGVCLLPRKKCERHTGWQKVREADYEVERAVLSRRLDRIAAQEEKLAMQIKDQVEAAEFRLKHRGQVFKKPLLTPVVDDVLPLVDAEAAAENIAPLESKDNVVGMEIEETKPEDVPIEQPVHEGVVGGATLQENGFVRDT